MAVLAGTIASSSGTATVTPTPCRNVRRGMCFFVMNISDSSAASDLCHCPSATVAAPAVASAGVIRIRNGGLRTMPSTIDENR